MHVYGQKRMSSPALNLQLSMTCHVMFCCGTELQPSARRANALIPELCLQPNDTLLLTQYHWVYSTLFALGFTQYSFFFPRISSRMSHNMHSILSPWASLNGNSAWDFPGILWPWLIDCFSGVLVRYFRKCSSLGGCWCFPNDLALVYRICALVMKITAVMGHSRYSYQGCMLSM